MKKQFVLSKRELREIKEEARQEGYGRGFRDAEYAAKKSVEDAYREMATLLFLLARGDIKVELSTPESATDISLATGTVRIPVGFVGLYLLQRTYDKPTDCWMYAARRG